MPYHSPDVTVLLFGEEDILTTSRPGGGIPDFGDDNVKDNGWL